MDQEKREIIAHTLVRAIPLTCTLCIQLSVHQCDSGKEALINFSPMLSHPPHFSLNTHKAQISQTPVPHCAAWTRQLKSCVHLSSSVSQRGLTWLHPLPFTFTWTHSSGHLTSLIISLFLPEASVWTRSPELTAVFLFLKATHLQHSSKHERKRAEMCSKPPTNPFAHLLSCNSPKYCSLFNEMLFFAPTEHHGAMAASTRTVPERRDHRL